MMVHRSTNSGEMNGRPRGLQTCWLWMLLSAWLLLAAYRTVRRSYFYFPEERHQAFFGPWTIAYAVFWTTSQAFLG